MEKARAITPKSSGARNLARIMALAKLNRRVKNDADARKKAPELTFLESSCLLGLNPESATDGSLHIFTCAPRGQG